MSSTTHVPNEQEMMGTKPIQEHQWLQKLVGNWKTETEMNMGPDQTTHAQGTETVKSLGGLWAFAEGMSKMPNGTPMEYYATLGYDVSFKEYRGCWFASMSSHLWKQTGKLSADGKTMTLDCVGPSMTKDGETANYRDVIEIIDEHHRTMKSSGQDDEGNWNTHMVVHYTRI